MLLPAVARGGCGQTPGHAVADRCARLDQKTAEPVSESEGSGLPIIFPPEITWCRVQLLATLMVAPCAVHAGWTVADDVPGKTGCVLETEEITLFDGYADTRLRLSVADGVLRARTESNIDFSFDDVGLAVDGREFIPADAVVDEKDVLFSSDMETLIDQFIRGRAVTVYLRFWPTYPATQRYETRISLAGFTRAYRDYQACRSKLPS